MAHNVICLKCGIKFDRDKIQAVKIGGRRYGHAECYPDNTDLVPLEVKPVEDKDRKELTDYISKLYGDKANWPLINKQIAKYKKENNYTYSGMRKALEYFYEVNHNKTEESNGGVGIILFVYDQAYQYYYNIWLAQQATENKTLFTQIKEFIIKPPKMRGSKNKLLDWFEEEEE